MAFSMPDTQEFNLKFVKVVEDHPVVYNFHLAEYSNKAKTEMEWSEISRRVHCSAAQCKMRWKNLRCGYLRHLRTNVSGIKRKYYLESVMAFLLPYAKPRKIPSNLNIEKVNFLYTPNSSLLIESNEESDSSQIILPDILNSSGGIKEEMEDDDQQETISLIEDEAICPTKRGRVEAEVNHNSFEDEAPPYQEGKRTKANPVEAEMNPNSFEVGVPPHRENKRTTKEEENSHMLFFRSILPLLGSFNLSQTIRFRKGCLEVIENIAEPTER